MKEVKILSRSEYIADPKVALDFASEGYAVSVLNEDGKEVMRFSACGVNYDSEEVLELKNRVKELEEAIDNLTALKLSEIIMESVGEMALAADSGDDPCSDLREMFMETDMELMEAKSRIEELEAELKTK